MEYSELLKAKGFSLNSYPEGKFWEMIVTDNEDKKQHICNVFGADIELFDSNITDIDTLILQCAEDLQNVFSIMIVIHLIWNQIHS